mmetsp:Transcript_54414/g.100532  ORF Transcript_54414/g.100532 Transcript_54414/m.100532 type:complete len:804 (-) Transcript_54414:136-2547(-)
MTILAARLNPSRRLSELSRWSQGSHGSTSPQASQVGRRRGSKGRLSKRWLHVETGSQATAPTHLSELSTTEGGSKRTSALCSVGTSLGASTAASPRGNDLALQRWDLDCTDLTDALEALANAGVDAGAFFSEARQQGVEGLPHGVEAYIQHEAQQMKGRGCGDLEWTEVWDDDELDEADSAPVSGGPSLSPRSPLLQEQCSRGGRKGVRDLLLSLPPLPDLSPSLEPTSPTLLSREEISVQSSAKSKEGSTFLQTLKSAASRPLKVGVREDGEILFVHRKLAPWQGQNEDLPPLPHLEAARVDDMVVSPGRLSEVDQPPTGVEALLWELRCRLAAVGVRPDAKLAVRRRTRPQRARKPERVIQAVLEQIRQLRSRRDRRKQMRCASLRECRADKRDILHMCRLAQMAVPAKHALASLEAIDKDLKFQLTHEEWLELCSSLRFNLEEAEQLYASVVDTNTLLVDLPCLFDSLLTLVGPDISLERFVGRLVLLFGSPDAAFESVTLEHVGMGWPEFQTLAQSMAVNERNALRIWKLLAELQHDLDDKEVTAVAVDLQGVVECTITKEIFTRQLSTWMPRTSLDKLSLQLCEKYGSVSQGMQALQRRGLRPTRLLSASRLQKALHDIGIRGCNAEQVLIGAEVVLAQCSPRCERKLTLEDLECILLILQMCTGFGQQEQHAAIAVREDTARLWACLRKLKVDLSDCRRLMDSSAANSGLAAQEPACKRYQPGAALRRASQVSCISQRKTELRVRGSARSRVYERSFPTSSAWAPESKHTRGLGSVFNKQADTAARSPNIRHMLGGA